LSSFILRWNLNREPNPRGRRRRRERFPLAYRLLIPIALVEGVFVLYPILQGILMSVQFTQGGITSFVGLANFQQMLTDPDFWGSIRVTLQFAACMIAIWLICGLALAMLMNWSFRGRGLARALLAIPWAVPDIPIVLTFSIMLDPNVGIINRFVSWLPWVTNHHIAWLSSPDLSFVSIVLMAGWKGMPFYALILLSSLQSISDELYEAATVDGANFIRRFTAITIPALIPTISLLSVLAFIFAFQQFSLIYLTTGGGPGIDTSTLAVLIYLQAFQFFNYNFAAALAVIGLLMAVAAAVLFVLIQRRIVETNYVGAG
jgi:multiple sugar transport system permease protein